MKFGDNLNLTRDSALTIRMFDEIKIPIDENRFRNLLKIYEHDLSRLLEQVKTVNNDYGNERIPLKDMQLEFGDHDEEIRMIGENLKTYFPDVSISYGTNTTGDTTMFQGMDMGSDIPSITPEFMFDMVPIDITMCLIGEYEGIEERYGPSLDERSSADLINDELYGPCIFQKDIRAKQNLLKQQYPEYYEYSRNSIAVAENQGVIFDSSPIQESLLMLGSTDKSFIQYIEDNVAPQLKIPINGVRSIPIKKKKQTEPLHGVLLDTNELGRPEMNHLYNLMGVEEDYSGQNPLEEYSIELSAIST